MHSMVADPHNHPHTILPHTILTVLRPSDETLKDVTFSSEGRSDGKQKTKTISGGLQGGSGPADPGGRTGDVAVEGTAGSGGHAVSVVPGGRASLRRKARRAWETRESRGERGAAGADPRVAGGAGP